MVAPLDFTGYVQIVKCGIVIALEKESLSPMEDKQPSGLISVLFVSSPQG